MVLKGTSMPALSRIMYVDDDPDLRAIAEISLRDLSGFTVELCGSGEEALQKAAAFNPQIVLLDVMMPGMDGIETFKRLQEFPQTANTPIVFVSAKVQSQEVHAYLALGAAGVIPKPFDPLALGEQARSLWSEYHESFNTPADRGAPQHAAHAM
jgi:two-component system, OmpR family, response regulator